MKYFLAGVTAAFAMMGVAAANAGTLADVKARGKVICLIADSLPGFSSVDNEDKWQGFDIDICKAIAAAVLGDAKKIIIKSTGTSKQLFAGLKASKGDVILRAPHTFSRGSDAKLSFQGVTYHDNQVIMVRKDLGVSSAAGLDGADMCFHTGSITELSLADYFSANSMVYIAKVSNTLAISMENYSLGRCEAISLEKSNLVALRTGLADPAAHKLLPEKIAKILLGLVTRSNDKQWGNIVRWVKNALVRAEELGVTSRNIATFSSVGKINVKLLLGSAGDHGSKIGLNAKWAARAISAVGNYGEIFDKHIGPNTPLKLKRGKNALSSKGGLQYSPPFR